MKYYSLLLLLAASAACADAPTRRDLKTFNHVELKGALTAEIVKGDKPSIELTGDPKDVADVTTEVEGDTLVVKTPRHEETPKNLRAVITTRALEGLRLSGAIMASAKGFSGGKLDIVAAGANTIELAGKFKSYDLELTGASTARLGRLEAKSGHISVAGACKAELGATGSLKGDVSGVSQIVYHGAPKTASITTSGVSSIQYEGK